MKVSTFLQDNTQHYCAQLSKRSFFFIFFFVVVFIFRIFLIKPPPNSITAEQVPWKGRAQTGQGRAGQGSSLADEVIVFVTIIPISTPVMYLQ